MLSMALISYFHFLEPKLEKKIGSNLSYLGPLDKIISVFLGLQIYSISKGSLVIVH
jgi:hypothetical protein